MNYAKLILDRTKDGLYVFNYYMPITFAPKKKFRNPFYEDTKPSCFIYYDKRLERYYMKDHGDPTYCGDCFWLAGLVLGLNPKTNFIKIAQHINQTLGLGLEMESPASNLLSPQKMLVQSNLLVCNQIEPKGKSSIRFNLSKKDFSKEDLCYWGQYGITIATLRKYNVCSLDAYSSKNDNGPYTIHAHPQRMMFAYDMNSFVKIYRPQEKNRFLYGGEKPLNYCFGLKQLPTSGDMVFITGGEKDVLSLAAHGFHAVCFNSETAELPVDVMTLLSERFRHVVIMYDCDETGRAAMAKQVEKWQDHDLLPVTLPLAGTKEDKDISDFFKNEGTADTLRKIVGEVLAATFEDSLLLISACEMDFSVPPMESERVVKVKDVPIASCDNLMCITGGEGTGKSNFVSSLLAGALHTEFPNSPIDTLGFDIMPNAKKHAVIHFDTEQSEQQLHKNTMMMMKRAGLKKLPSFYHSLFLTTLSRANRMRVIKDSLSYYYQKDGGVYMVVIDGVADLIKSANDEASSIAVVEELYKLASCYHACIICVLHYVPNGIKLRGHLGSELQRKSASILSVEKDENPAYSLVKAMKLRDGNPLDVPIQQFSWNKELGMFSYAGTKSETATANRKKMLLEQIVQTVYKIGTEGYTHTELVKRVEEEADVKERTAKSYISDLYNDKVIVKRGDKYIINNNRGNEQ